MMDHPGRIITSEVLASLVGDTWPQALTPVNILSGFKKSGISPMNPSEVSDRMLAPATVFKPSNCESSSTHPTFSAEQIALYEKRLKEGYDVHDPQYELWLREKQPESSDADSMKTHVSNSASTASSNGSSVLSEILKYPEVVSKTKGKRKLAINSRAICLSDSLAVQQLQKEEERKRVAEEEKVKKKEERERNKQERELLKEKEKEEKRKERERKGTKAEIKEAGWCI